METILTTIKKMLGIDSTYTAFDLDITVGINSALMTLNQLGVGPMEGFSIESGDETWDNFFDGAEHLKGAITFVYLTVKLTFDPPSAAYVVEAINNQLKELTSRLVAQVELTSEV